MVFSLLQNFSHFSQTQYFISGFWLFALNAHFSIVWISTTVKCRVSPNLGYNNFTPKDEDEENVLENKNMLGGKNMLEDENTPKIRFPKIFWQIWKNTSQTKKIEFLNQNYGKIPIIWNNTPEILKNTFGSNMQNWRKKYSKSGKIHWKIQKNIKNQKIWNILLKTWKILVRHKKSSSLNFGWKIWKNTFFQLWPLFGYYNFVGFYCNI